MAMFHEGKEQIIGAGGSPFYALATSPLKSFYAFDNMLMGCHPLALSHQTPEQFTGGE